MVSNGLGERFGEVLLAAQGGDERAFESLWRATNPAVVRYLRGLAGNHGDDLATETWIGVLRNLEGFSGTEAAWRGWVFTIARRRWVDWCRKRGVRPETLVGDGLDAAGVPTQPSGGGDDVANEVVTRTSVEEILEVIAELGGDQAEAVLLRVVADLDVAEVAALMGKSPGAVRVLTHRGLNRLADLLVAGNAGHEPGELPHSRTTRSRRP